MKFIRFDKVHFGYLIDDHEITQEEAHAMRDRFTEWWPGKKLIIVAASEFIDMTGQYEIVPVAQDEAVA